MGLSSGALSMSRYKVLGLKKTSLSALNKGLLRNQAPEITLGSTLGKTQKQEQAFWVLPNLPDQARDGNYWDMLDCQVDGGYVLRIRIEKRQVPSELINSLVKERLQALARKLERRPNRVEARQVKAELKDELLSAALPNIRYVELFWSEECEEVILFSTAKSACMHFEHLFRDSFLKPLGGELIALLPPLLALDDSDWKGHSPRPEAISKLVPSVIGQLN